MSITEFLFNCHVNNVRDLSLKEHAIVAGGDSWAGTPEGRTPVIANGDIARSHWLCANGSLLEAQTWMACWDSKLDTFGGENRGRGRGRGRRLSENEGGYGGEYVVIWAGESDGEDEEDEEYSTSSC